jgi:hypothetical protein
MGFWQGMMKMIQGKPVFEAPAGTKQPPIVNEPPSRPAMDTAVETPPVVSPPAAIKQPHTPPTFDLKHCKSDIDGTNITVTVWVTNTSPVDIEIDKCVILNQTTQIDRRLSPNGAHEVILYRGATPTTDYAHKANIFYKSVHENEYYRADFSVEFNRESDGTFTIEDLHPEHYAIKEY